MKFRKLDLLAQNMPTWALFLTLDNAGDHAPGMDALDFATGADMDALDARKLDPVGYHSVDAFAVLDDEIDDFSRDYSGKPFENEAWFVSMHD